MDKRKVILAYRKGLISLQECAQILGIDNVRLLGMIREPSVDRAAAKAKQSVRS